MADPTFQDVNTPELSSLLVVHGKSSKDPAVPIDRSGAIAVGGTAQSLMPANPARRGMWLQNHSNADIWINGTGAATLGQPSLRVPAGQLYESPAHGATTGAISVIGATAGQAFSAREW